MHNGEQEEVEEEGRRVDLPDTFGQDERSLVKLPFTTIGRGSSRALRGELHSTWPGKVGNRTVQFFKTVTGNAKYGLPEFPAEEVYIGLLYYTARNGFSSREVRVVPRHLLRTMQWDDNGASYKRLKRSLNQLVGVTMHTNALWNDKSKQFDEAAFGIIDDWRIEKSPDAPLFGEVSGDALVVRWNEILFKHFRRGRLKLLNVSLYYSLSTPLARRLYRYLDEALYPHGRVEIDVCLLAHVRLEISKTRAYPSSILQSLRPALEELKGRGICGWEMVDSKTESGKKFVFTRTVDEQDEAPALAAASVAASSEEPLLVRLSRLGEEEREDLEREAVARLDSFNRSIWNERGRSALGTYQLVLKHMQEMLNDQNASVGRAA